MLTEKTDRAWFSHLSLHPARKWSGSILPPSPHRANQPVGPRRTTDDQGNSGWLNTTRACLRVGAMMTYVDCILQVPALHGKHGRT